MNASLRLVSRRENVYGRELRHHQAVHPDHIGKELQVAALAAEGVIEALESERRRFLLGVQWHLERMTDDGNRRRLFDFFYQGLQRKIGNDFCNNRVYIVSIERSFGWNI
jgi:gamma-glutamyl-gamma-aminobutyrate hydrolase PuuD